MVCLLLSSAPRIFVLQKYKIVKKHYLCVMCGIVPLGYAAANVT